MIHREEERGEVWEEEHRGVKKESWPRNEG